MSPEVPFILVNFSFFLCVAALPLASVRGDTSEAAGIYATIGSLPDEAYARLRAAEALANAGRRDEADVELDRALDFYRSVGAARYVREGEALLAARQRG